MTARCQSSVLDQGRVFELQQLYCIHSIITLGQCRTKYRSGLARFDRPLAQLGYALCCLEARRLWSSGLDWVGPIQLTLHNGPTEEELCSKPQHCKPADKSEPLHQ